MNRAEALGRLTTARSQRERLDAARVLSRTAIEADVVELQRALREERVPWIRSALETAIARGLARPELDDAQRDRDIVPLSGEDDALAEVYARALEELTDRFVHEFRPLVGLARLSATDEVPHYETTRVWSVLTQMQDLLGAIDTLGKAAALASPVEFDLGELARDVVANSSLEFEGRLEAVPNIEAEGPAFCVVVADRDLVALALKNGLRNAIEASVGHEESIVVTWGQSDTDYWVVILDRGDGLRADREPNFAIGFSTKPQHSGMGLAIAHRAAMTLGGQVELSTTLDGATRFELRCSHGER